MSINGVLLIHKEKEFTSFDVVAVVRKCLSQKKAGHTGTLDPNATGILPVLLGTATKAQDIIPCQDKRYIADFKLGIATDTLDIWGEVIEEKPAHCTAREVEKALEAFRGRIEQLPPMYSAVSIDGKRLYQYAREGKEVARTPRAVTVYTLDLIRFDEKMQSGRLEIACSKGTYVRSLIDDIARSLGTVGVMTDLIRSEACDYSLCDAITLDQLKAITQNGEIDESAPYWRSVESLFDVYPELTVSDKQAHRFKNGNPLDVMRTEIKNTAEDQKIYRVKDREGAFLSLGIVQDDMIKMYKHF